MKNLFSHIKNQRLRNGFQNKHHFQGPKKLCFQKNTAFFSQTCLSDRLVTCGTKALLFSKKSSPLSHKNPLNQTKILHIQRSLSFQRSETQNKSVARFGRNSDLTPGRDLCPSLFARNMRPSTQTTSSLHSFSSRGMPSMRRYLGDGCPKELPFPSIADMRPTFNSTLAFLRSASPQPAVRHISDVNWTINSKSDKVELIIPADANGIPFNELDATKRKITPAGEVKDIKFKVFRVNLEGEVESIKMSKKDLLLNHFPSQVQLRDLRIVTTQQNKRQISSIITRKNAIILKFEYLKAVIAPEAVFIFDAEEIHVKDFVDVLKKKLESNRHREETAVPQDPFEFCVLEAMLEHVSETFESRLYFFTMVSNTFERMTKAPDFSTLMRLVMFKQALNFFETDIKEFTSAVNEVLEKEEDLVAMYLNHNPHPTPEDTKPLNYDVAELEMLFEGFHKKMEEISNEVTQLGKNLEDSTRLHELSLDSTRNRLMHLNLQLSMFTTALNSGMLIAAIFGMNLLNHYEEHELAFGKVAMATVGLATISYIGFLWWYIKSNNRAAEHMSVGRSFHSEIFHKHPSGYKFGEFRKTLEQALGKRITDSEAQYLFHCFDKNRDGVINFEHKDDWKNKP